MQTSHAADYANKLLSGLGCAERVDRLSDHPALAWKRSGLLDTTKLMLSSPLASHADGALMALKALSSQAELPKSGALLMGERVRLRGLVRQGRESAGGLGRILDTKDGRIAVNLVREDDWDLSPAWLEDNAEDWADITRIVKTRESDDLITRASELGLAVAKVELPARPSDWLTINRFESGPTSQSPLIVDLSSLWAGPLASNLLNLIGARVIKIESPKRPDGARSGHEGFYSLLNAGKDCVALDFKNAGDLGQLKGLLSEANIVIEASRPRALQQLGIVAEEFVAAKPGMIWARITAYGRSENRIGFGDDIGVSAGLTSLMADAYDEPCFVGDAIADPVSGLHLALAIQALRLQGGGAVLDISMRDVLRYAMGDLPADPAKTAREWQTIANQDNQPLYSLRSPVGAVKASGADNGKWL
ncbi:MAG: CoA transferase [Hyphomonadaceae bacterium]|nr:CoA transferase [Hyphomonadaceae bacterium]